MKRLLSRPGRAACALGLTVILGTLLFTIAFDADSGIEPVFDRGMYYAVMSAQVAGLDDIIADFELRQFEYLFIAPPGEDPWVQGGGILPFDPEDFPKDFVAGLVPETRNGITNYTVYVFEDPETHERVFANADQTEIAAVDPPDDYDPNWFVDYRYPDLHERGWDEDYIEFITACYRPDRVVMRYRLMAEPEVIKYVWRASIEAVLLAESGSGGMMCSTWEGGSVTNIQFVGIGPVSNGVEVLIAYPTNTMDELDIFSCSDLIEGWFDLAATIDTSTNTNCVAWVDTDATNVSVRHYAAGNADSNSITDPDGDGLLWAREKYMYHTCPTNSDTDGDGLSDYEEVIELDTDPNNDDTNPPSVQIVFPPNGYRWVWVP